MIKEFNTMAELMLQKAEIADLLDVMEITKQAKALLKADGINQWQAGYPNEDDFENDIVKGHLYVAKLEKTVVGFISLIDGIDPWYKIIENGAWLRYDQPYYTIHRVAVSLSASGQQVGYRMLRAAILKCLELDATIASIRVDTHPLNTRMQHLLEKVGFVKTGEIFINEGELRFAYEYLKA
ncbi:GNAT family N-acetyltransferase [Periweissella beninensis]|uniref:GNAT family N-acetyltransferase n=2 Tax=Periweissella beninensis TaxID=504936 RepID=A0ABT0VJN9_9LACO|nr:GNAT family N-acetyltransferase [Periweissella beninensis]